jgi:hypothetical protein
MADRTESDRPGSGSAWERRRRLAEIFGDTLPETTADEREPGEGSNAAVERGDTWLREQVPPHYGGS